MTFSYILYIGLLAVCWLLAFLANRYDKKGYVFLIIGLLTLISGLRGASVGIDTSNYLRLFGLIKAGRFHLAYGLETSFKFIMYGIMWIVQDKQIVLTLLALVTNWCILIRFWELRKIASFSCMVVCYYMAFFFMTMNGTRQFLAVGLVFYATKYLSQKKIMRFVAFVLVATLFHQSAFIGFVLLALNCLRWKELPRLQKIMYIFSVLMIPVLILPVVQLASRYSKYFTNLKFDVGMMLMLKLAFLIATLILVFVMNRRFGYFRYGRQITKEDRFNILTSCMCYGFALVLAALGYVFPFVDRISWYFYLFEGVYFGMLLKGKKQLERVVFGYFIAFVMAYGFLYSMTNNSQGTMPYSFFWEM